MSVLTTPPNKSLDRSCRLRASHQTYSELRLVALAGGNPVNSDVIPLRYLWRLGQDRQ